MFNDFFDFDNDGELNAFERAAEYQCYTETTGDNSDDEYDNESHSFDRDSDFE